MSEDVQTGRSARSEVAVPVDPATAFAVFVGELDLWWVRGPINHHAAGRVVEMHCEPGVGGRLLEVYDRPDGEVLELGVITVWEPGRRLAWTSSLDDVETEVTFEPAASGTEVRVTARIPAGGADRGGTAWVRVVPLWFGAWCRRRNETPHAVRDIARLALTVRYERPAAAARWLAAAFGFEATSPLPEGEDPLTEDDHGHPWIEFRIGNSSLVVLPRGEATDGGDRCLPWVYVDDVDAHTRHAAGVGATVVEPPSAPWGLPMYVAEDLEGMRWTFLQARPTMR